MEGDEMSWFIEYMKEHPEVAARATEEGRRAAEIEVVKSLNIKNHPLEMLWQVDTISKDTCPICGNEFDYMDLINQEPRCPSCNQLFSIEYYYT